MELAPIPELLPITKVGEIVAFLLTQVSDLDFKPFEHTL